VGGIGILVAFLAGIVSFASPCCLPLVPAYVGYMVGTTPDGETTARRRAALGQALAFVVGFSTVFVLLWASVGLIGYLFRDYVGILRQLGGAILIFMGLNVAGVINISALYRDVRLPVGPMGGATMGFGQAVPATPSYGRSALLGVVFAAGWTPCIGPILGGIIGLATVSASVAEGTILLVAYATGLAIPFILVAVGATAVSHRLGWLRDHYSVVRLITGAMLVLVGFLMITNTFARLSGLLPPFGV
jgi:cytochrome c-type biogenesis protein